jgi:hypothetical protein
MKTLFDPEIYESSMNYWKLVDGVVWYRTKWPNSAWRVDTTQDAVSFARWIEIGAINEVHH